MAKRKLCIGIDIGASAVKLCQLSKGNSGLMLDCFGLAPLPPETIVDGALMNTSHVVNAIQDLVTAHHIKQKQVALSISGHAVIIKKIALPQMSADELAESTLWEAEQFIPFDINDVRLDVQIVNPESTQKGQMDVVLVAAKKNYVTDYTSLILEAGLEPTICDVDAFAIENAFIHNYSLDNNESVALVNVGAQKTNINILTHGVSSFTHDLAAGGTHFTEELQRQLAVSREDAESLKQTPRDRHGNENESLMAPEVQRALEHVAELLTTDVQRAIDFYAATSAEKPPSRIYLSGGSARLTCLRRKLAARLDAQIIVMDPFRQINVASESKETINIVGPTATVAVGLAMRYPGDSWE